MPVGMDSKPTSELAYPAKLLQICWFLREKLAMPREMSCERTSVYA